MKILKINITISILAMIFFVSSAQAVVKGTLLLPINNWLFTSNTVTPEPNADNGTFRLLFADADTFAYQTWVFRMPEDFSSGLIMKILYSMDSANTSDEVALYVYVKKLSDGDSDPDGNIGFDTSNAATPTVPDTEGELDEISITLTNDDSVAAGDWVAIKLARWGGSGSDTASGDMEVRAVSLEYTTDR